MRIRHGVQSSLFSLGLLVCLTGIVPAQERDRDFRPGERERDFPQVHRYPLEKKEVQYTLEMQEDMKRLEALKHAIEQLEKAGLGDQAEPLRRAAMGIQVEMARQSREQNPPPGPPMQQMEQMKHEIERLRAEVSELRQMIRQLNSRIEQPNPPFYRDQRPRRDEDPLLENPKLPKTEPDAVPYREEKPRIQKLEKQDGDVKEPVLPPLTETKS